jgi:hypothetical protein
VPVAPSNLSAVADSSSQISISWLDNSNNESGFRIERSLNGSSWSEIDTVASNINSYTDTGLSSETTYYYQVNAFNANGDSAYTNSTSATTDVAAAIFLSANGYKVKGRHNVNLTWSGATSLVDIYRDGNLITTATANDGFYTDNIGAKGGATYVYQVCETASAVCSNEFTVNF